MKKTGKLKCPFFLSESNKVHVFVMLVCYQYCYTKCSNYLSWTLFDLLRKKGHFTFFDRSITLVHFE